MARVYESHTNRALVRNYFIAHKYCVLPRCVAKKYIIDFPLIHFSMHIPDYLLAMAVSIENVLECPRHMYVSKAYYVSNHFNERE